MSVDAREPSFQELSPRERLAALLDENPRPVELLGPFERLDSPWLLGQGIVPQADDGVILQRASLDGRPVLAMAIEPAFEGGSLGEVGGAKIAAALEHAALTAMPAILLLESGGVRLSEANLGLAAIARIQFAIVNLRALAPVIAIITGPTGCFGGVSLTAQLCTHIIGTPFGRLGMNGPEVIEIEAGPDELDASDRQAIWQMIGCEHRHRQGFVDFLVEDRTKSIAYALRAALVRPAANRLAHPERHLKTLRETYPLPQPSLPQNVTTAQPSRAQLWMDCLCGPTVRAASGVPSVVTGTLSLASQTIFTTAIIPDPNSRLPRAAAGQLGLEQAWALAATVRDFTAAQAQRLNKDPILCLVDSPGQAFGRIEETLCISAACAAAVEAYAEARRAGHPVITLVVGQAISGSFLAHGLQSGHIVAFDDPAVLMHAMSPQSAARITRRTLAEFQAASAAIAPASYAITAAQSLGLVDTLLAGIHADAPTPDDLDAVRYALLHALSHCATPSERQLSLMHNALRAATVAVDQLLHHQWEAVSTSQAEPHAQLVT